jgi:radical SAM superfamily enzyme YgiQ (UPF0313 family)
MRKIVVLCSPTSEVWKDILSGLYTDEKFYPPLGLLLVAQALRNAGYAIKLYDGNYNLGYKDDLSRYVRENKKDIVYVGFYLALLQIKDCIAAIEEVKLLNSGISIVVGGPLPEAFGGMVIKSGLIDICCTGDGADVSVRLADSLSSGGDLSSISNITFKDNQQVISNPVKERDSLDNENKISYEEFIDIDWYADKFSIYLPRQYDKSIKRAMPILTGLGCSYKCAFCQNALLGHNHISLPAEDIVEQIAYYNKNFNIDSFSIFDEDFFIDKTRLFKFLELLKKADLDIKWGTQCRANYFNDNYINDKLLKELEARGCVRLCMGIESGSPRILKMLKKGITPENAIKAAEYGKDSSIYFSYDFIVNLPGETKKDLLMSFDLVDRLLKIKKNSYIVAFHNYIAYPGTPLSIEAERKMGFRLQDRLDLKELGELSIEKYNSLVNLKKNSSYLECLQYYYYRLKRPFELGLSLGSIYHNISRTVGLIRKKFHFYSLPLEIYCVRCFKYIINQVRFLVNRGKAL